MAAASTNRQARGRAREERILRATLELIEREGVGAVTHRAVARGDDGRGGGAGHEEPAAVEEACVVHGHSNARGAVNWRRRSR